MRLGWLYGLALLPVPCAAAEVAATLKSLRGQAVIERSGQQVPARAGDALYATDRIRTGSDAYLGIGFIDRSLLSIGPNSDVELSKYRFDRTTHEGAQEMRIRMGHLASISGQIAKANPEQVRFNTGTVTLGARGTTFVIDMDGSDVCAPGWHWKDIQGIAVRSGAGECVRWQGEPPNGYAPGTTHFHLLPDRDGKAGAIRLQGVGVALDIDKAYAGAIATEGQPLRPLQSDGKYLAHRYDQLLAALPPTAQQFTVRFFSGAPDRLTPESVVVLQSLQAAIASWPGVADLSVIGHTDSVGASSANDALSTRRAEVVRTLLIKQGISPERIHAAGRGEREPLIPTGDETAEEQNRRVEITLY